MSFWRGLDEGEIWISPFKAGSHGGISINEWALCPSTEPKLPDSTSSPPSLSLSLPLSLLFHQFLSVTCCEIPRRRQEEKNQEADIWFSCAAKPTLRNARHSVLKIIFLLARGILPLLLVLAQLCLLTLHFCVYLVNAILHRFNPQQIPGKGLGINLQNSNSPLTLLPLVATVTPPAGRSIGLDGLLAVANSKWDAVPNPGKNHAPSGYNVLSPLWKLQNSLPDVSTNITVQVQLCMCTCAKIQQSCLTPC